MSNSMKSSNEFQQYEAQGPKGKEDQKWNKRGNNPKGKDMNCLQRDDKGNEYPDPQQFQRHPNKKNYSSYSNKNQGDDYDKGNQGNKGNNQSPNYKKIAKGKKDNYGDYQGNNTIDDGINEKDDYSAYKKINTQQPYGNKDIGGYSQKQKGRHIQNGQAGQNMLNQNANPIGNYQQLNQTPQNQPQLAGGYYDKSNFSGNAYQNSYQIQQFNQQGQGQSLNTNLGNQGQGQQEYGYRGHYQGDHKSNMNMNMPMNNIQSKGVNVNVNAINPNGFNINNNQHNQSKIQFLNTETNYFNNIASSLNQEQKPLSEGEDNYNSQLEQQYSLNPGPGYMQEHIEGNPYMQNINDQMLPNQMNQPIFSMVNPNAPMQSFQNIKRNYQQDLYFQQQMPDQGNHYLIDPSMLKGINRVPNMGMMNMPQVEQHSQMYQMPSQSQVSYGMNHNNASGGQGGMVKTKKKSSKKISSQYQDNSNSNNANNNKNSMKMHYNNNNGKYYKGSHSTQGAKNTMPNFNGGSLSFMNMANNKSNNPNSLNPNSLNPNQNQNQINMQQNPQMNMNASISNQQMASNPSFSSNQPPTKGYNKQKRSTNNPYRSVISDKTVGTSGNNIPITKLKQNDYYKANKAQQQQQRQQQDYYKYNPQSMQKFQQKSEELSNFETDYDASIIGSSRESLDFYQKHPNSSIDNNSNGNGNVNVNNNNNGNGSNSSNNNVSLYIKVKLEDNREIIVDLKHNKDIAEALKSYNIKDNQLTYIFYKIVEAFDISDKILHVPLEPYDRKQLMAFNKITAQAHSHNQRCKRQAHSLFHFPNIQIDDIDTSYSFASNTYESIINELKPEYSDIRQYDLLNTTQ